MSDDRSRSHRRIVWFTLCALLLFPALTGCFSSDGVDPPLDRFNVEFLYLLRLGSDGQKGEVEPQSLALVEDETLAIGTEDVGVYFADLSNPAEPSVVGIFEHEGDGIVNVLAMDGFVYGYARTAEFLAIDARQPAAPQLAFRMPGQEEDRDRRLRRLRLADMPIAAEEGLLYLSMQGGIHIFNAADPYALSLEGVYYPPQTRARGSFMAGTPGVVPTAPQLEAEKALGNFLAHEDYPTESLPCSRRHIENALILGATLADELLYVWVDKVACVGPEQEVVAEYVPRDGGSPTPFYGPARHEVEDGGVWVLDVRDPSEPLPISFLSLQDMRAYPIGVGSFDRFGVAAAGNYLYLTPQGDLSGDSTIVDISVPERPVLLDKQVNADWVYRVGNLLLVSIVHVHDNGFFNYSNYSNGLQVFDISDAANPTLIGMMSESPEPGQAFVWISDIAALDSYIYVSESQLFVDGSIHVLRLIDPDWRPESAPTEESDTSP